MGADVGVFVGQCQYDWLLGASEVIQRHPPLTGKATVCDIENGHNAIEIVDFIQLEDGGSFHSYVAVYHVG